MDRLVLMKILANLIHEVADMNDSKYESIKKDGHMKFRHYQDLGPIPLSQSFKAVDITIEY